MIPTFRISVRRDPRRSNDRIRSVAGVFPTGERREGDENGELEATTGDRDRCYPGLSLPNVGIRVLRITRVGTSIGSGRTLDDRFPESRCGPIEPVTRRFRKSVRSRTTASDRDPIYRHTYVNAGPRRRIRTLPRGWQPLEGGARRGTRPPRPYTGLRNVLPYFGTQLSTADPYDRAQPTVSPHPHCLIF